VHARSMEYPTSHAVWEGSKAATLPRDRVFRDSGNVVLYIIAFM